MSNDSKYFDIDIYVDADFASGWATELGTNPDSVISRTCYIIEVMGANETAYEEKIDLLQHEISDLAEENQILKRPRPWYKSAPLWATITGAAGLVLGVYVGVGI